MVRRVAREAGRPQCEFIRMAGQPPLASEGAELQSIEYTGAVADGWVSMRRPLPGVMTGHPDDLHAATFSNAVDGVSLMKIRHLPALALLLASTLAAPAAWAQKVRLSTSMGDIVLQLDAAKAPKTVENFVQYVKDGHYSGTIFHRVIGNFMIQGGGMNADMSEKPTRAPIALESRNGLNNDRGTHDEPQLRHRAVFHQPAKQRLPERGPIARWQWLRGVWQGGGRPGRGRQDQGRAHRQQGPVPKRARASRGDQERHPAALSSPLRQPGRHQGTTGVACN
jgi:hypothetical protein